MRGLALALAGVVLLAASASPAAAFYRFPTFDQLAAQVAGRSVDVRCATLEEWASDPAVISNPNARAYTRWEGDSPQYSVLEPRTCMGLLLLVVDPDDKRASRINPRANVFRLQGEGLFYFAHEAAHLSGLRDETAADCAALAALPGLLTAIGVVGERAAGFQSLARRIHEQAPPEYRAYPCPDA